MSGTLDGVEYTVYGGFNAQAFFALGGVVHAGSPGFFRTGRIGARLVLIDPLDRVFIGRGCFKVNTDEGGRTDQNNPAGVGGKTLIQYVTTKYGDNTFAWAKGATQKLWKLHFNFIGEDRRVYADPLVTSTDAAWNAPYWDGSTNASPFHNPWRMPQIGFNHGILYAMENLNNLLGGGINASPKNLFSVDYDYYDMFGENDTTAHHSRIAALGGGYFAPDAYDPALATYLNAWAVHPSNGQWVNSPWLVATQMDDKDNLYGLSAGHPAETGGAPFTYEPHIGMVALVSADPIVTGRSKRQSGTLITYTSGTNHTKAALASFLSDRYGGSISALNTAWGTGGFYTSFGHDGGWRVGTGILDENGRGHAWLGTPPGNKTEPWSNSLLWNANVKQDLDDFGYLYTKQLLTVMRTACKTAAPDVLFMGPSTIAGSFGGPGRAHVLRACAEVLDLFAHAATDQFRTATYINAMTAYMETAMTSGGALPVPLLQWTGIKANPDSSIYYLNPAPVDYLTQAARGVGYQTNFQRLLDAHGANWYPHCGIEWWSMYDRSNGESSNWGLVTERDNNYDGGDYTAATTDALTGATTILEATGKVYGDFHTALKAAHLAILDTLTFEYANPPVPDPPDPTPPAAARIQDFFARSDSTSLGAAYTETSGNARIVTQAVYPSSDGSRAEVRCNTVLQSSNMYTAGRVVSWLTPQSGGSNPPNYFEVCARFDASARTFYAFRYRLAPTGVTTADLVKCVAGTVTVLGGGSATTTADVPVANDVIRIEVDGDTVTGKRNGTQVLQVTSETSIASGPRGGFAIGSGLGSSFWTGFDDFDTGPLTPDSTPPAAPGNPHATSTLAGAVALVWDAATDATGISKYQVFRNGVLLADDIADTTYTDTTALGSTYYKYIIRAFDTTGWATDSTGVTMTTSEGEASAQAGGLLGSLVGAL